MGNATNAAMVAANATRWAQAKITRTASFPPVATRLVKAKDRYLAVAARTGVPWFVIAVIHERECSQSWRGSLAQGDAWDRTSVHVPAGRGPFKSWEDCAVDALVNCPPYAARNKNWSVGGTLSVLEGYNGLGYFTKGRASPYIWAGTDQYKSGKYIRDGVYDPNVVDQQLGCAGLILAMMALDASIKFGVAAANDNVPARTIANSAGRAAGQVVVPAHPDTVPAPSIAHPAPGSLGAFVAQFFHLFKRAA